MTRPADAESFEAAWKKLGELYPPESWFRDIHLAQSKGRIRRIVGDLTALVPAGQGRPVIDVGCYNGFLCQLLHQFGYVTSGVDAIPDREVPERAGILERSGGSFYQGNFNALEPFPDCPQERFSAVVLGGIIEVIFNHPFGLLEKLRGLLVRDGILVFTAINPHTLANSLRVLRGQATMQGDAEFAKTPKLGADGQILSYQVNNLVYREYPLDLLVTFLEQAGFTVLKGEYFGAEAHPRQPRLARWVKATPLWGRLQRTRLFGGGIYLVARRAG